MARSVLSRMVRRESTYRSLRQSVLARSSSRTLHLQVGSCHRCCRASSYRCCCLRLLRRLFLLSSRDHDGGESKESKLQRKQILLQSVSKNDVIRPRGFSSTSPHRSPDVATNNDEGTQHSRTAERLLLHKPTCFRTDRCTACLTTWYRVRTISRRWQLLCVPPTTALLVSLVVLDRML